MDKKKVLIAFLGRAKYEDTIYNLNGNRYSEKLAFMAIHKHFSPIDRTYILGTSESSWELVKDIPYKSIEIPYGKKEEEFWKIFDILKKSIDIKDSHVIFDFTHGFRVLPFFGVIFVRLMQYIEPTASPFNIFYGSYEPGQKETPIVDLSSFIELLDWIDAVNAFIKYGEADALASKVGYEYNKAYRENLPEKPKIIGTFYRRLDKVSKILHLTYTPLLMPESRELSDVIESNELQDEAERFVKPLGLILERLKEFTTRFEKKRTWESHLEVAKFYAENNRLTQALLVLRETIISYLCEKQGIDLYNIDLREDIARNLNNECIKSNEPLHKLWNKIREMRNDVGHAFMKLKGHEAKPQKVAERVRKIIEEAEKSIEKGEQ